MRRLRENARFLVRERVPADASPVEAHAAAVAARSPRKPRRRRRPRRPTTARPSAGRSSPGRRRAPEALRAAPPGPSRPSLAGSGNGGRPIAPGDALDRGDRGRGAALLAGIGFGATRLLGDEGDTPKTKSGAAWWGRPRSRSSTAPPRAGLRPEFAGLLKPGGYKTGPVTSRGLPDTSVVMFDQMDPNAQRAAQQVAADVGIQDIQPMSTEIQSISEGDSGGDPRERTRPRRRQLVRDYHRHLGNLRPETQPRDDRGCGGRGARRGDGGGDGAHPEGPRTGPGRLQRQAEDEARALPAVLPTPETDTVDVAIVDATGRWW